MHQRTFVERDTHTRVAYFTQVDTLAAGCVDNRALKRANFNRDRVKERRGLYRKTVSLQSAGHTDGFAVHGLGNGFKSFWTVKDGIKTRDIGQQCLSGANVRSRLLSPNVLLASLQGKAVGCVAFGID